MPYSMFTKKAAATDKDNVVESLQLTLKNFEGIKKDYKVFNVLNIGRLMLGEAYYHEVDEYYNCVGFEVEVETQFDFGEGRVSELEKSVGFYSIWIGKSHPASPFTFEESYQPLGKAHRFDNGLGDHIQVIDEIISLDEMQEIIKEYKLNG